MDTDSTEARIFIIDNGEEYDDARIYLVRVLPGEEARLLAEVQKMIDAKRDMYARLSYKFPAPCWNARVVATCPESAFTWGEYDEVEHTVDTFIEMKRK